MTATSTSSPAITIMTYVLILFSVALAITGQICLRRGMTDVKETYHDKYGDSTVTFDPGEIKLTDMLKDNPWGLLVTICTNLIVLLGLLLFVASAASWLVVLADVPLGVAYPFVSLTYIVVFLYDWRLDDGSAIYHHANAWNWIGVVAIVGGVWMLSAGRRA